jgi:hypothetical protein
MIAKKQGNALLFYALYAIKANCKLPGTQISINGPRQIFINSHTEKHGIIQKFSAQTSNFLYLRSAFINR